MLALHLHFLTGRYAATAYNDRSTGEWPPHPARLFSALVDALYAESPADADEAAALDRLAALPPPLVCASGAHARRVMTVFVPINDAAVTDAATLAKREDELRAARRALQSLAPDASSKERAACEKRLDKARSNLAERSRIEARAGKSIPKDNPGPRALPWGRLKQPRTFPVMVPHVPHAAFVWPEADLSSAMTGALEAVAGRVVRLGHSSSFVQVRVGTDVEVPDLHTWRPDTDGSEVMRVPIEGHRAALDREYERHGGDLPGRVLPARHARYHRIQEGTPEGTTRQTGDRWIVYQLDGPGLPPAHATVAVADSFRDALLSRLDDARPPALTGLDGGAPTRAPHLAVVPLPFAGHKHADGAIRGIALSLPAETALETQRALLRALGVWEAEGDAEARAIQLPFGERRLSATRVLDPESALQTLQRWRWSTPSRRWLTVTPIALDGDCAPLGHSDPSTRRRAWRTAAKLVRKAVVRAVEPPEGHTLTAEDIDLTLVFDVPVRGGAHLRSVPRYQRPAHPRPRRLVHAVIELPFPVRGPLLLGSGRHFGLGLCMPDRHHSGEADE